MIEYDEYDRCRNCGWDRENGHRPSARCGEPTEQNQGQPSVRLVRMADVAPEQISWLWPGYIPAGKLTLVDGDPGDGKSTMSVDLAARVSTGSPMPDGSPGTKGSVIVLSAEDGLADTIRPRLDAAGADVGAVFVLDEVINAEGVARPVELPLDLPLLAQVVRQQRARLITIDPLMAFLAGVDSHNDQSVRRALHPLAKLADSTGAAVLVIRHLNKGSGSKALYRGGGSIGIAGAARAVHLVAVDPADESGQRRLLAPVKVNIGVKPPTMAYRLVPDESHGCARVRWEGTVSATADDLVSIADADERDEKVSAVDFLRQELADGARRSKEIEEIAREVYGISPRTITNARRKLRVVAVKHKDGWWIELPRADDKTEGQDSKTATP